MFEVNNDDLDGFDPTQALFLQLLDVTFGTQYCSHDQNAKANLR